MSDPAEFNKAVAEAIQTLIRTEQIKFKVNYNEYYGHETLNIVVTVLGVDFVTETQVKINPSDNREGW